MSQLMIHRGARLVERAELDQVEVPPATETWFPLRHNLVLGTVETTLQDAGFSISRTQLALSQDNARFFGTIDLQTPIVEGVSLTVGVRNSFDKTFPIGLCAGNRVFVCDNLAFSAEIYVAKKHTRFGQQRFREGIANAVASLHQYQNAEARRIEDFKVRMVDEQEAAACLLHGFEEGILTTRTLPMALAEWRKPSVEDFQPRTAWSLFNALTAALKERQSNPARFASLTMRVYGLLGTRPEESALAL